MNLSLQIVIAFAILACALCQTKTEGRNQIERKCMSKTGATAEDMKVVSMALMPTTRTHFCLLACVYKENGSMDASNKFILPNVLEEIGHLKERDLSIYNKIESAFKECAKKVVPVSDECETLKLFVQCVQVLV